MSDAFEQMTVIRLWALADAFETRLAAELERFGMSIAGFRLVGELMQAPDGLRQRELASRLRVKPPTVSAAVTRLQEQGLVERRRDPDDPRAWRVCLANDAPLSEGLAVLQRIESDLLRGLSPAARSRSRHTLEQLHKNLLDEGSHDD